MFIEPEETLAVGRLIDWVHGGDPAVVPMFWRLEGQSLRALCALCGTERPLDAPGSLGAFHLALLGPSAAATIANLHGFGELRRQPLLRGECWYSVCGACYVSSDPVAVNAEVARRVAMRTSQN